MVMQREVLEKFVREKFPDRDEEIMSKFVQFHSSLLEENQKVNLISRQTLAQDIWTKHFLDSILCVDKLELTDQRILDLGTGGGLPGIPLKIIFPDIKLYLLDSKTKKIKAVKKILKKLDFSDCFTIVSRLEELDERWDGYFDVIVCRSVRIESRYREKLMNLLSASGYLLLYKSKQLDDVWQFENRTIHNVDHPAVGTRKMVIIKKVSEGCMYG
jgi:16S rRNA (guanine527-N7)-methyltransferase